MGLRLATLYLIILAVLIYAWRDWFIALCCAIALSAITEHTDMPRQMFGIPGCTPWNFLMIGLFPPWLLQRKAAGYGLDMPPPMKILLFGYVGVILVAGVRGAADASSIAPGNSAGIAFEPLGFAIEHLLDPFKLMFPALLVYDGARTRRRVIGVLVAIAIMGLLYAVMVARRMDPVYLLAGEAHLRGRLKLQRAIGLHSNDLATIMSATCWGVVASVSIWRSKKMRVLSIGVAGAIGMGMLLCFSRAGYISFAAVGLVLAILGWRKLLILMPIGLVVLFLAAPNVLNRLSMGFGDMDFTGQAQTNLDVVTSGRATDLWPLAIEEISASPIIGYGRRAILRTPMYDKLVAEFEECPSHPHNAYLEILMDGGVVSLVAVLAFFGGIWLMSAQLFRVRDNPVVRAIGGLSVAHTTVLLVTSLSAQSLYPKRSMVAMMCAWALAARVWTERRKAGADRARPAPSPMAGTNAGQSWQT